VNLPIEEVYTAIPKEKETNISTNIIVGEEEVCGQVGWGGNPVI
jgi:hypothetical protein